MESTFVDSINEFSLDLFQTAHNSRAELTDNTVLSSLSVLISMLMALSGAKQQTKLEIIKALKIESFFDLSTENSNMDTIDSLIKKILQDISYKQDEEPDKIVIANKVIIKNLLVNSAFKETLETTFGANIGYFEPSIIEETNKWISMLTNNKIEKILKPDFLETKSCLAIINAVYFKYDWMYQFQENLTKKEVFLTTSNQVPLQVDMMKLVGKQLPYFFSESLNSHIIRLPYNKQRFSLNIIFPTSENDFLIKSDDLSLINKITYRELKTEMENLRPVSVDLQMPKFKINKEIKLNSMLQELGIKNAFTNSADFSGINLKDKLYIEEVLQFFHMDMNEKGTEAAAATVVKISKRSLPTEPIEIKLNRPYIYFITESSKNLILFIGSFNGLSDVSAEENLFQNKTEL